jgi:hypothetical protein
MNTFTVLFPWLRPLASHIDSLHSPLSECISPLFTYLEIPLVVIVVRMFHPLSSLVSDQLFTPSFLTLPNPSRRHPWFMLHVHRDDITTSATLSDTRRSVVCTGVVNTGCTGLCTTTVPDRKEEHSKKKSTGYVRYGLQLTLV